jgi:hypothetical protein
VHYSEKAKIKVQCKHSLDLSPLQITSIVYENNVSSSLNKISTPCQILIKEGHFNLSTMLNLKRPMDVPIEYTQTRTYIINKGSMILYFHGDKCEQKSW